MNFGFTLATFPQSKNSLTPIRYDAEWAPELVWGQWTREEKC